MIFEGIRLKKQFQTWITNNMQKTSFQLELAMWSAFPGLWFQSASFPECAEQVWLWPTEPIKHFEIVSSAHLFLQEELILNILVGLSGHMASCFPDCLVFCVLFFKRFPLLQMFVHLQAHIVRNHGSVPSLQPVPLAALFGQQCISKEQLTLMQLG